MKSRIEQEIDNTLDCLGNHDGIEVSCLFMDAVSNKVNGLSPRHAGNRIKAFYPMVVAIMVIFNLAILAAAISPQRATAETSDPISVIASEYGVGQSAYGDL